MMMVSEHALRVLVVMVMVVVVFVAIYSQPFEPCIGDDDELMVVVTKSDEEQEGVVNENRTMSGG